VGGLALIGSGYFTYTYFSEDSEARKARVGVPPEITDVCAQSVRDNAQASYALAAADACKHSTSANGAWPWAWVFGTVGVAGIATGVYLLVTDPKGKEQPAKAASVRFTPVLSREPGFTLSGRF